MSKAKLNFEDHGFEPQTQDLGEFLSNEKIILESLYYDNPSPQDKERIELMLEFVEYYLRAQSYKQVEIPEEKLQQIETEINHFLVNDAVY